MTGWAFLAFLITAVVSGLGGMLFGAAWVRDDIAARQRDAEIEARLRRLPLTYEPSTCDQRHGLRIVEGGRR